MRATLAITKKEFYEFFASASAYVFVAVFLLVSFGIFFAEVFASGQTELRIFFSWVPLLFIVFLPALTMSKWAEEKKTGTIELLLTMPVSEWAVIAGKYFSTVLVLAVVLTLSAPLAVVLSQIGDLDVGQTVGGFLGVFFLGAAYLAVGLFVSSLTKNQVVAFVVTVASLFLIYIIAEPIVTAYLPKQMIPVVQALSFHHHYLSMARGVIDVRDIVFFVSAVVLFGYFNHISLQMRKV